MTKPNKRSAHVLVVDDDKELSESVSSGLRDAGFSTECLVSGKEAAVRIQAGEYDALVTDLRMADVEGLDLLRASHKLWRDVPVIVMTAFSAVESAIESIRQGAYHYMTKPFRVSELVLFLSRALDEASLRRETRSLRAAIDQHFSLASVISRSVAMQEVCALVSRIALASSPVLLTGETGTGKGRLARTIHREGTRRHAPFVTVNCAAVSESLLESELFGHVKGAFTGANAAREGLFVEADGGTVFLDEIGEMSPALQAKLLDVLERSVVRAVGSDREKKIDVRIVAATHRDLQARVSAAAFREDLLYRLNVLSIHVPSLKHRREDIPALVQELLHETRERNPTSPVRTIPPALLQRLLDYSWPGNVRELAHAIERLVVLGDAEQAQEKHLPPQLLRPVDAASDVSFGGEVIPVRVLQRRYAAWALEHLGGRKMLACEKLGIDSKTLAAWLAE